MRSNAARLGIDHDKIANRDLHIHLPQGAIKKDGPSAGVALTCAVVSVFTKRPIRNDVAITGEIDLRGHALPIGGIKEKVLAAHRAGIKIVFLPERNQKDTIDIPEEIRRPARHPLHDEDRRRARGRARRGAADAASPSPRSRRRPRRAAARWATACRADTAGSADASLRVVSRPGQSPLGRASAKAKKSPDATKGELRARAATRCSRS